MKIVVRIMCGIISLFYLRISDFIYEDTKPNYVWYNKKILSQNNRKHYILVLIMCEIMEGSQPRISYKFYEGACPNDRANNEKIFNNTGFSYE